MSKLAIESVSRIFPGVRRGKPTRALEPTDLAVADADFVTIKLASGNLVRIPRTGIVGSADGVLIGMTAEQLEAQVSASAAPAEDAPAQ